MNNSELREFFDGCGVVLFDAAMGTALQTAGQPQGTRSEAMNLTAPETVLNIHRENIKAGSDVVTSNTFGVSAMMLRGGTDREKALLALDEGIRLAKKAADEATEPAANGGRKRLACLGLGPTGAIFEPIGDVSYETAEEVFAVQAEAGANAGAAFILMETFADAEEFRHAALAARKAAPELPVLGTMTFDAGGRSFMGAAPADAVRIAKEYGLTAIGANCSLDPFEIAGIAAAFTGDVTNGLYVIMQPNAGQPVREGGEITYKMTPERFAEGARALIELGISGIGGCCGTTPKAIAAIRGIIDNRRE